MPGESIRAPAVSPSGIQTTGSRETAERRLALTDPAMHVVTDFVWQQRDLKGGRADKRTQDDAVTPERTSWRVRVLRSIHELGSYAAIVLIIPGGSLLGLCLLMLRHRAWLAARTRQVLAAVLAFGASLILPP
jgi:hypothetical protein